MQQSTVRAWFWVHKWSSLISTLFLFMLCLTGLPLIFHDEIDTLTEGTPIYGMPNVGSASGAAGMMPLDDMMRRALEARPNEVPVFMAFDKDQPLMTITTAPRPDSSDSDMTVQLFDRSTGEAMGALDDSGVMHFLLQLHNDMFLGLMGMLFLGLMGLLFIAALISGVVLYAPFMRKLPFGTVRTQRRARVKWIDYHNLLGITALVWMLVVGATGVINALATPIVQAWQMTELAEMTAEYQGKAAVLPQDYSSLDRAMEKARAALPNDIPQFIAFPGGAFSSKNHYAVFFHGATPLTEKLLTPALIDAATGEFTASRPTPWYMQALGLSQPLHFGDYGGLPLKLLWAALTIFTMIVLGSGLYLWLAKRRGGEGRNISSEEVAA